MIQHDVPRRKKCRGEEARQIREADELMTRLSEDLGVPKPNYGVYKVTCVKSLEPWKTKLDS